MKAGWQFFTRYEPWADDTSVFMRYTDHMGKQHLVLPLACKELSPGEADQAPSLSSRSGTFITPDVDGFLQAALDTAWQHGLRPKGFADHENELTAVRYHLEDMRTLAKLPGKTRS